MTETNEMEDSAENPFSRSGPIVRADRFHGREEEIDEILSRITADQPQCVSVLGPEGIGKSSLLNYVADKANRGEFYAPADSYVCLSKEFAPNDSTETFFRDIRERLHEDYPGLLDHMEPSNQGLNELIAELGDANKKLILFMDNFEIPLLSDDFPSDFFSFLRGKANNNDVGYVTATSERLTTLFKEKNRPESPFPNIFGVVPLGAMNEESARSIVEYPIKGKRSPLADYSGDVYGLAGGFPLLIQRLCAELYSRCAAHGKLQTEDVEAASAEVLDECSAYLRGCWNQLSDEEHTVCGRLLKGERVDEFQDALNSLSERGYILLDPKSGQSVLFPALMRRFARKELHIDKPDTLTGGTLLERLRKRFR